MFNLYREFTMGAFKQIILPISSLTIFIFISACSSNTQSKVPVVDKTTSYNHQVKTSTVTPQGTVVKATNYNYATSNNDKHIVKQGETLYSLAFSYGRDWREVAADNNISAPYAIYPGQTIYLNGKSSAIGSTTTTTKTSSSGSVKVTTQKTPATASSSNTAKAATTATAASSVKTTTAVVGGWTWPAMGTVIGTFSPAGTLNKGIDISAAEGTPVVAAAAGTVVYAGNNLHGYGNLLIIKHNDSYVSAYAHNRQLLVKEGQKVAVGQKIAEMGSTGADRVKLHFEIRLNGKPVDPLKYLPKK